MENTVHELASVSPPATAPPLSFTYGVPRAAMTTSVHDALTHLKNEIDAIQPVGIWDDAKKITNPYEYIFLSLQKRMHRSIATVQPLSRSYFKMIELWELLGLRTTTTGLRTSHSAEGPGGFIEAIMTKAPGSRSSAMTLRSTERSVPGWRKSNTFLLTHPTVAITYGADGTGNLYSLANQAAFAAASTTHLGGHADLYTADGGFDFSTDYNGQENTVQRLLAAEALAGLQTLKPGGTMILKVFDTKQIATLELLWILSGCFTRTALVKPHTSRPANSERYWIGLGLSDKIPAWIPSLLARLTDTDATHGWVTLFAERPWTPDWLAGYQRFQEEVEQHQFVNIQMTLNVIKSPSRPQVLEMLTHNIHQSRTWCVRHKVAENPQYAGISDASLAALNLEEALGPFLGSAGRMCSPGPSRPLPTPRAPISQPSQRPQAGPAWRSALPPSILGLRASQTASDTPSPTEPAPPVSHGEPGPAPVLPVHPSPSGAHPRSADSPE